MLSRLGIANIQPKDIMGGSMNISGSKYRGYRFVVSVLTLRRVSECEMSRRCCVFYASRLGIGLTSCDLTIFGGRLSWKGFEARPLKLIAHFPCRLSSFSGTVSRQFAEVGRPIRYSICQPSARVFIMSLMRLVHCDMPRS